MTTYKVTKREQKEFAAMVRGDHPLEQSFKRYVLAQIRDARRRVSMMVGEIDMVGLALKADFIGPEKAVEWMARISALDFILPAEPTGGEDDLDGRRDVPAATAEAG